MPRFFFDVQEAGVFTADEEGTELVGREEVFAQARRLLLDIARDLQEQPDRMLLEVTVREGVGPFFHSHTLELRARQLGEAPST